MNSQPSLSSIFIVCKDVKKTSQFYQTLGFRLLKSKSRSHVLSLGTNAELHLHSALTNQETKDYGVSWSVGSSGLVHSYQVDDLDQVHKILPPCNLLRGPTNAPWGSRILLALDPEGNRLEFQERTT